MKSFTYFEPTTLDQALEFMAQYGGDVKPLAGGTDLLVAYLHGTTPPGHIVSLSNLASLSFIREEGGLHLGAATVLHQIERSEVVRQRCQMVAEGAALIGSRQIRNLATVGGNICNAVPSADMAPPLLAAEAEVVLASTNQRRQIPLKEFFVGPRQTVLSPDELALEFVLPPPPPHTGSVYRRHTLRQALDLAMVGVAVCVTLGQDRVIRQARVALGAVAPVPLRAAEAERVLLGHVLSEDLLEEAAVQAERAARPISDVRGAASYRRDMIRVLTKRCVREAVERARS